jgi:hypothetical protein
MFEDQKNTILYQAQSFIILMYIQRDATLHSLFYLETALHVSGGTFTHHQEHNCIYRIWYLSDRYGYLPL